jgi:hypothetical protein
MGLRGSDQTYQACFSLLLRVILVVVVVCCGYCWRLLHSGRVGGGSLVGKQKMLSYVGHVVGYRVQSGLIDTK